MPLGKAPGGRRPAGGHCSRGSRAGRSKFDGGEKLPRPVRPRGPGVVRRDGGDLRRPCGDPAPYPVSTAGDRPGRRRTSHRHGRRSRRPRRQDGGGDAGGVLVDAGAADVHPAAAMCRHPGRAAAPPGMTATRRRSARPAARGGAPRGRRDSAPTRRRPGRPPRRTPPRRPRWPGRADPWPPRPPRPGPPRPPRTRRRGSARTPKPPSTTGPGPACRPPAAADRVAGVAPPVRVGPAPVQGAPRRRPAAPAPDAASDDRPGVVPVDEPYDLPLQVGEAAGRGRLAQGPGRVPRVGEDDPPGGRPAVLAEPEHHDRHPHPVADDPGRHLVPRNRPFRPFRPPTRPRP